jgi:hypothetical protein
MNSLLKSLKSLCVIVGLAGTLHQAVAAEWFVSTTGKPDAPGTKAAPWDLESALSGKQKIAPGDTLWIHSGTYKHPDRKLGTPGYVVRLAGQQDRPIQVRAAPGERVTLDGGLSVQQPATWLWIRDLEILVSENFSMPREVKEPGSSPKDYNRPWGGLNIHSGEGCKFINLVIHDNAQGISWWSGSTNSEVYGCIIYDNGWKAPDRGHGHAIYTQNKEGIKTISDCIMTGGFSYTMHAYGSSQAYVDNYLIEGNIAYNAGLFLIGGGRPSHNIRALNNFLYNVSMQIGYSAKENEDCEVRGNVILGGGLNINKYKKVVKEDNLVLGRNDPRPTAPAVPTEPGVRVDLRPNRYDPERANVVVFNWAKKPAVSLQPATLLKPGDKYRLIDPREFYGKPVVAGTFEGKPIEVPVAGEFAAFVLLLTSD